MYHYDLAFVLVRMPDQVVSIFSHLLPLERFSHDVKGVSSLEEVPSGTEWPLNTFVILNDETEWSMRKLREKFGGKARIILCTAHADKLEASVLNQVYDFWPWPLSDMFARLEAVRLQQRIKDEKEAWMTSQYLDIVTEMLPDMMWFKDMPGCHLRVNQAFCEAVGKTKEDVTNQYHGYIWGLSGEEAEYGEAVCRASELAVAKAGKTCHSEETVYHSKRGLCELSILKTPVYDENHEIIGTVGIARDVTKEKEAQKQLLTMANTDALTGLHNRNFFYQRLRNRRKGESLTLCYIDLDHFKYINDTYGHKVGDEVLTTVANLLRKTFSDGFITRMGGDEFVVALFGADDRNKIKERMDFVINALKEFLRHDERMKTLSMSIGIAKTENEEADLDLLLQQSDEALYWSKEHGRDQYAFYDEILNEIHRFKEHVRHERRNTEE
ncbi:MAG: sensor domain-containing diguanylate cyclase [Acidaminococcaceae bacterium]|nr:sensor domain-containing diguanylate cyclase [Acidaminococcaceae bacterium]